MEKLGCSCVRMRGEDLQAAPKSTAGGAVLYGQGGSKWRTRRMGRRACRFSCLVWGVEYVPERQPQPRALDCGTRASSVPVYSSTPYYPFLIAGRNVMIHHRQLGSVVGPRVSLNRPSGCWLGSEQFRSCPVPHCKSQKCKFWEV